VLHRSRLPRQKKFAPIERNNETVAANSGQFVFLPATVPSDGAEEPRKGR